MVHLLWKIIWVWQFLKQATSIWPTIAFLSIYPKEIKTYVHPKTCIQNSLNSFIHNTWNWNYPRYQVVIKLSCRTVCGILVPWPEIKLVPSALEGGFSTTEPPGKSRFPHLILYYSYEKALCTFFFAGNLLYLFFCKFMWIYYFRIKG